MKKCIGEYGRFLVLVAIMATYFSLSTTAATRNHEAQMNAILDLNQSVILYKATPAELRDAVRQVQQDCECQDK